MEKKPFTAYRCKICKIIFPSMHDLLDHWHDDHKNDGFHVFDFTTLQDKREKRNLNLDFDDMK